MLKRPWRSAAVSHDAARSSAIFLFSPSGRSQLKIPCTAQAVNISTCCRQPLDEPRDNICICSIYYHRMHFSRASVNAARAFRVKNALAGYCTKQRSRGAMRPRLDRVHPRKWEGAGNAGCTLHPRSRAQWRSWCAHEHTGSAEAPGIPCVMALRLMPCSPVTGLFCHRRPRICFV
jgi:hypothetical protein